MYAKIENDKVIKFPYTMRDLQAEAPNTSFAGFSAPVMEEYGIVEVTMTHNTLIDGNGAHLAIDTIEKVGKEWKQVWKLEKLPLEDASENIKTMRNHLLKKTDWRFRSDQSPTQEWIDYCQALRDITDSKDYPYNIEWPTEPK